MSHGQTVTVEIRESVYTARELSVAEVREWLKELEQQPVEVEPGQYDLIDDALMEVTFQDVMRMSDMDKDALADLYPSEVQQMIDAIKQANPHFFDLRSRLLARGQSLQG